MSMPSVAYKVKDKAFIKAVKTSISIRQVLIKLNLNATGSAYRVCKKRISQLNIDTTHFKGQGYLKGRNHDWAVKRSLEDILVENSTYSNTVALKERLIKEGLLINECSCGVKDTWNGKPIILQLDHINGQHNDHRINNLRILCPNCHSQTSTFAGKNHGGHGGT